MDEKRLRLQCSVREASKHCVDSCGKTFRIISLAGTVTLAERMDCSRKEVEIAALEAGVIPERYQRNIGTVGIEGQLGLLRSHGAVVGAGGLGGLAIELLARMGVGKLTIIDGDSFTGSNLNRQLHALERTLGAGKVETTAFRMGEVNCSVEVIAHSCYADESNLPELLEGCGVVLDCLDNLSSRLALENACQKLGIPLVHGAVAGFTGQLAVIWPGEPLFHKIYGSGKNSEDRGAEVLLGNPAPTPAVVAAWQCGEAVKILTGMADAIRGRLLLIHMLSGETTSFQI